MINLTSWNELTFIDRFNKKGKNIEIKFYKGLFPMTFEEKSGLSEEGKRNRVRGDKFDTHREKIIPDPRRHSLISDKRKLGYISSLYLLFFCDFFFFFFFCYFTMLSKNRFNLIRIKASSSSSWKAPPRLRRGRYKIRNCSLSLVDFFHGVAFEIQGEEGGVIDWISNTLADELNF